MSDYLMTAKVFLKISGIIPIPEQNLPLFLRDYHEAVNYAQIFIGTTPLVLYSASSSYYLFFEPVTYIKFCEAAFYLIGTLMEMALYFTLLSKRSKLISFIDELEKMIKRSKLTFIFVIILISLKSKIA